MAKVYSQSFKESYTKEFPCIKSSKLGDRYAFCDLCRCDFTVAHGERYDFSRHVNSAKHVEKAKNNNKNAQLDRFFSSSTNLDVIRAEVLLTSFLGEHNVPLAAADHAGPLFQKMFPKCEIAKQYGCARTKTSALISEMATNQLKVMIMQMKNSPFSVACDGSNDTDFKMYPVVISYFDQSERLIQSNLLSILSLTGDATGENISSLILNELKKHNVSPGNCIAFMADNAAVMHGKKNGVAAFLRHAQEHIITMGCSCHLINLAAEKAAAVLPIKVDEILVDIYYYLNKSSKQKETLKHFQSLHDKDAQKILKHVCTRWLSLGRSLSRLVEQWDPFLSFFTNCVKAQHANISCSLSSFQIAKKTENVDLIHVNAAKEKSAASVAKKKLFSTKEKSASNKRKNTCTAENSQKRARQHSNAASVSRILSREEKLFMFLSSLENKAYCFFLLSSLPVFEKVNTLLQSGSPYIHKLREVYHNLLKELFCKFLKPAVIKGKDLISVKYHLKENHKELSEIVIGNSTTEAIAGFDAEQKKTFLCTVINYFNKTSCDYIVHKFPLNNEVLINAKGADLARIESSKFSSVKYFINLFPCMLNAKGTKAEVLDELENQFCSLQIEDLSGICNGSKPIDAQWVEVQDIKGASGNPKYKELSNVMLSILLIPHSNAECERIFSVVKKKQE